MSDEQREQADCASCGTTLDLENDLVSTDSGDLLCEDCRIYCERCEEYCYSNDSSYVYNEGTWCYSCADNYTYWCEGCENTYSDDHAQDYISDLDVYWCCGCASNNANWCDNCEQYYRDNCRSDRCEIRLINNYSYKPNPIFYGESKDNLFFGLELEMEVSNDREVRRSASQCVADRLSTDWIYLKEDGSIGNTDEGKVGPDGFELVSHPATLDYWSNNSKELWDTLDILRTKYGARSWNAKSNCGIHIHISRSGFKSGAHTHRFLSLIYRNAKHMKRFAGRDCGKYATFTDVWKYDEDNNPYRSFSDKLVCNNSDPWDLHRSVNGSQRMSAVNTRNPNTIELRFFRGTTKPTGVLATLELAHALVEYTRNLTLSDVRLGMLDWEWFADYIEANNGLYPNAYARIPKLDKISLKYPEVINA